MRGPGLPRALGRLLEPFLGVVLVMAVFYAIPPHPAITLLDLRTVLVQTVITGIAAYGMTFVILSGGIDLSVGSSVALTGVAAALVLRDTGSLFLAVLAALAAGALCGLYNGLLVTLLRLPPFIATLGTLGFFRGLSKWLSGSVPVNLEPGALAALEAWVRPIPAPGWLLFAPAVWLLLGLGVLLAAVQGRTVFGRHATAVGSNEATARLCGLRVGGLKVRVYVLAGALAGLAGLMQFGRLTQGDPTVAIGLELDVIAAVVIGGGSLAGGKGSLAGTLAGAFLMAWLRNRCTVLFWPNYVQEMIVGHVILVAVALDQWRLRRQVV